ncbi:MAG TPA: sulfatase-like hydrolase/transferase [Chitinophagaceae bacterium]|nr:sulfatase-like hydrolase/transferase [Chitinophagaceae bacterium]
MVWLIIGIVSSLLSHFIIDFLFYNYNFEVARRVMFDTRTEVFLLGAGILFIFYILLSSIFGSSFLGGAILITLAGIIGTITRYKNLLRAEPLFPNEFYMIKELPSLMTMLGIKKSALLILIFVSILILLFLFYKYVIKRRRNTSISKEEIIIRIIGGVGALSLIFYIGRFNYPNNKVKAMYNNHVHWVDYNQSKNYSDNGFVAGFLSNLKAPPMNTPDNYSEKSIEMIYEKYADISQQINKSKSDSNLDTNILFVMNESFSDPFNLVGIDSDRDPLTNYREIIGNSENGKILAPNFGGGTATNEFEVLTGFLMEPFASQITSPYIQLTTQMTNFPSVAKKLKFSNYKTTAIHPYIPSFYRRNDVYSNLGFDEFRHQDNMKNKDKVSETHRYISDQSAYKEIFEVMETSKNPDFIHLVTMQNHTSYKEKYEEVDFEVEGSGNSEEANAYFQDLENSDKALKTFIKQIDDFNEPILLIFWGDHLPGFYAGDVLEANEEKTLYETPFFIYSNQMSLNNEGGLISPAYLSNYITDILDIKITPYEALLKKLQEQLPVIDKRMYIEKDNNTLLYSRADLSTEALQVLEEYSLLMYDMTTGNQYSQKLGFFN